MDADVRAHQQAAFRAARHKFALYGRQHAHVSHLSAQGGDAAALTNTLLLQENGALALHADDLQYRLDGILFQQKRANPGANDDEAEERIALARARNTVELARMLRRPDVQRTLKLSRSSARLCITRIHDVAALLRRSRVNARPGGDCSAEKERSADELLRLSVATLLFSLTLAGAECGEWFPRTVLDVMAECLQHEFDAQVLKMKKEKNAEARLDADSRPAANEGIKRNVDPALLEKQSPSRRRKTCLKRKKQSYQRKRSMSTSGDDDDAADPQDQLLRGIAALLSGHDGFGRIKRAQVTVADVLVLTLHNLLQMNTGEDQQQQGAHRRKADVGLAGATFATLRARKRQLLENNALHTLVDALAHQVQQLQWPSVTAISRSSFAESNACSLQRIETILRVLDQASFLETEVQRQLSSSRGIFAILLELVEQLSTLCWGQHKHDNEACDEEETTLLHGDVILAEVLLVSMRVLINLTHHNEDAARHIYGLHGMKTLFRSFCLLWEANGSTPARSSGVKATVVHEDKLLFDAFLMFLSALTNCTEFSPENRDAVTTIAVSKGKAMALGIEGLKAPSVCGVVTKFFLSKVQSYRRLLEWSNTNPDGGAFAHMEINENVQWVPEDVVLGGCSSLLLGCLIKNSPLNAMQVLDELPDQSPRLLLRALSAFVALHSQIGALTPEVGESVLQVEQTFKSLLVHDGVNGSPAILVDTSNASPALSLTISAKITMVSTERSGCDAMSLRESASAFSGEQVEEKSENTLCADLGKKVRTPPASAFKLHSWKKVCSTVDSDDECDGAGDSRQEEQDAASGTRDAPPSVQRGRKDKTLVNRKNATGASRATTPTASPLKKASPYRGVTKGSLKRKQASPAKLKRASALKPQARGIVKEQSSSSSTHASPLKFKDASPIKSSPAFNGVSGNNTHDPNDGPMQKLKRARHLITGLEAALSRVDDRASTVMPSARLSACVTLTKSLSQNDGGGDGSSSRTPDFFHDDVADRVMLLNVRNSPFRSKAKSARPNIKSSPSPARKTGTSLRKVQTDQLQALVLPQDQRQATTIASLSLSLDAASSSKAALTAAEGAMGDAGDQVAVSSSPSTKRRKQKTAKPLKKGVAAGIFDFDT